MTQFIRNIYPTTETREIYKKNEKTDYVVKVHFKE